MGLISWLSEKIGGASTDEANLNTSSTFKEYYDLYANTCFRELAFWSSVNIVANAISKCKFKTYKSGEEDKGQEFYLWNVSPNVNQNSSTFIHKLIAQLYRYNECLVVEWNGQLFIADSFSVERSTLYGDSFTNVCVDDFSFSKFFTQSDVLYFKLSEVNARQLINRIYENYSKLLSYTMKAYQKSRGTKGIFNFESMPIAGSKQKERFDDLISNRFKEFGEKENCILPLGKGETYTEIGSKTYASDSTRDIRAMIDDISDFTAKAFGIPPTLLRGNIQDVSNAVDQLLTFCIDPLTDMLEEEINRKRYGASSFLKGNYLHIDTKAIKHIDILEASSQISSIISSGVYNTNEVRDICNDAPINEDWANSHFITKNYTGVNEMNADNETNRADKEITAKGGETDK